MKHPALTIFFAILSLNLCAQPVKYAAVSKNGRCMIIDQNNRVLVNNIDMPNAFDENGIRYNEGIFKFTGRGEVKGFKNFRNEMIVPPVYDETRDFINGAGVVNYHGKWGAVDKKGRLIVDTAYAYVSDADTEGLIILVDKYGFVSGANTKGDMVFTTSFLAFGDKPAFHEGLMAVAVRGNKEYSFDGNKYNNGKIGFIDREGRLVIDTIFQTTGMMRLGTYPVGICGSGYARLREQGYSPSYYMTNGYGLFAGGRALVRAHSRNAVINTLGDTLFTIPEYFEQIYNVGGLFTFHRKAQNARDVQSEDESVRYDAFGYIGEDGRIILLNRFRLDGRLRDGLIKVKIRQWREDGDVREEYKYLKTDGDFAFDGRGFPIAYDFEHGYASIAIPDSQVNWSGTKLRQAFLDTKGNLFMMKDSVGLIGWGGEDDWFIVSGREGGSNIVRGVMDRAGSLKIPIIYNDLQPFSKGYAAFRLGAHDEIQKWGYIDKKNNVIIPAQYDAAAPFQILKN